ncbi:MAG: family 1 extracellular solute-binding protein, partial [Paenibacillus sp.]|nr:family 1 extracellular solute-binding protein [Paenibacillus sp.]
MSKKTSVLAAMMLVPLISACGARTVSESPDSKAAENKPVELLFYMNSITQAEFDKFYVEPLKQKFPHITVKGIAPAKGSFIEELVAIGTVPDIFIGTKGSIPNQMNSLNLVEDIGSLVASEKYDLNRLDPATVDIMKKTANGKIIGLPLNINVNALYYNKDL